MSELLGSSTILTETLIPTLPKFRHVVARQEYNHDEETSDIETEDHTRSFHQIPTWCKIIKSLSLALYSQNFAILDNGEDRADKNLPEEYFTEK